MTKATRKDPSEALRKAALRFPEAEEGASCNRSAFKARSKAFLFMGFLGDSYDAMVKLSASLGDAVKLASKDPAHYKVGAHGWVTASFRRDEPAPLAMLEEWIDESYRNLVHKQLVAMLPVRALDAKKPAKKASAKKTSSR